jgi:hypothetical protein
MTGTKGGKSVQSAFASSGDQGVVHRNKIHAQAR